MVLPGTKLLSGLPVSKSWLLGWMVQVPAMQADLSSVPKEKRSKIQLILAFQGL